MALIATLTDNFSTKDTTKWDWGAAASVASGQLQIPCTSSWTAISSKTTYDLTNSAIFAQILQVPTGSGQGTMFLGKTTAYTDAFSFIVTGGSLLFGEWTSGSQNYTSITYSATTHKWWRIRHASGTVYWETSPDGATWTVQRSKSPNVSPITALYVKIQAGGSSSLGTLIVDNVNIAPGTAPTARLPWIDPRYFVTGTGTQTVDVSGTFSGTVDSYSLAGAPTGVTISSAGVISVPTGTAFNWTTATVRATNASGYAEATIELWVFTPNYTLTGGAAWSTISPTPGSIVAVRSGTYTSVQDISTWDGTSGQRTRVVAYPGETVTFDCSGQLYVAIETNNANWIELRGFKFIDDGGCNFALWNTTSTGMKVAQCEFSGFKLAAITTGQGSEGTAGPWIVEYCRIHNCVQHNYGGSMTAGGWARGLAIDYCDGSVVRRNRVYENWGEGIGFLGSTGCTVDGNITYNNFSGNVYLDNCATFEVHNNIVWSNNPTFYRQGEPSPSITAANEDYGNDSHEQPTTGLNVTINRILSGNVMPSYRGDYGDGGGSGTSVFTPNSTFTTIDTLWR